MEKQPFIRGDFVKSIEKSNSSSTLKEVRLLVTPLEQRKQRHFSFILGIGEKLLPWCCPSVGFTTAQPLDLKANIYKDI
jgi:hypothetical protein